MTTTFEAVVLYAFSFKSAELLLFPAPPSLCAHAIAPLLAPPFHPAVSFPFSPCPLEELGGGRAKLLSAVPLRALLSCGGERRGFRGSWRSQRGGGAAASGPRCSWDSFPNGPNCLLSPLPRLPAAPSVSGVLALWAPQAPALCTELNASVRLPALLGH